MRLTTGLSLARLKRIDIQDFLWNSGRTGYPGMDKSMKLHEAAGSSMLYTTCKIGQNRVKELRDRILQLL